MSERRSNDLRDRMQRVATKRPQHPDTPRRRAPHTTSKRRIAVAADARRRGPTTRSSARGERPAQDSASRGDERRDRLQTLLAWAEWELMSVPRQRLRWLWSLLRGE